MISALENPQCGQVSTDSRVMPVMRIDPYRLLADKIVQSRRSFMLARDIGANT